MSIPVIGKDVAELNSHGNLNLFNKSERLDIIFNKARKPRKSTPSVLLKYSWTFASLRYMGKNFKAELFVMSNS